MLGVAAASQQANEVYPQESPDSLTSDQRVVNIVSYYEKPYHARILEKRCRILPAGGLGVSHSI